jgi:hypothetical protein
MSVFRPACKKESQLQSKYVLSILSISIIKPPFNWAEHLAIPRMSSMENVHSAIMTLNHIQRQWRIVNSDTSLTLLKCICHQRITLFEYHLIGQLMENATFYCFMKLHGLLNSEILRILWVKVMGLNSKQLNISRSPICKFIHNITLGEWQNTFWAIQIFMGLIFYLIFYSIWRGGTLFMGRDPFHGAGGDDHQLF